MFIFKGTCEHCGQMPDLEELICDYCGTKHDIDDFAGLSFHFFPEDDVDPDMVDEEGNEYFFAKAFHFCGVRCYHEHQLDPSMAGFPDDQPYDLKLYVSSPVLKEFLQSI
jgi:hypothetical protein